MMQTARSKMSLFTKISTAADERSARLAGIGLMLLSIFMFSFGDALGKFMVATYSVGQLLWLRACAALLVLSPMIWRHRAELMRLERPWLQLLRVTLSTLEIAAFFLAAAYLPLADVVTYYQTTPIFVTALSAIMLREHVGWRRWSAVLIGFCGVVIALRPSSQTVSWPAVIALGGSLSFALLMLITRSLRATPDIVRQSLAEARTRKRRGAVSIFDDRLGRDVRLRGVRRRAVGRDGCGSGHHHRRRILHLPARARSG